MSAVSLRPTSFEEFGGQPSVTSDLRILVGAAKARGAMPDHVLLSGPPGLGKTTLAEIIARELAVPVVNTSGPALEKPGDLAALLSSLSHPCVVFVDEIHALDRKAEEMLYSAMEDGVLDIIVGEGAKTRTLRLPLVDFTLVGATTQTGLLSAPLRDRFGYLGRLSLYSDSDLASIVARSAALLGARIDADGAALIASRSRGTPRVANMWLRRVRDWAQVHGHGILTAQLAQEALESYGVDSLGLDAFARDLLTVLLVNFQGGPAGLSALASSLGEAPVTIEQVYEPHLLKLGLIARTPRGRVATPAAALHLGIAQPGSEDSGMLPYADQ